MEDLFGDVFIVSETPGKSTADLVHDESRYRLESNIPLNADPLPWWITIQGFPVLPRKFYAFQVHLFPVKECSAVQVTLLQLRNPELTLSW